MTTRIMGLECHTTFFSIKATNVLLFVTQLIFTVAVNNIFGCIYPLKGMWLNYMQDLHNSNWNINLVLRHLRI